MNNPFKFLSYKPQEYSCSNDAQRDHSDLNTFWRKTMLRLLCITGAIFACAAAQATQVATPTIFDNGCHIGSGMYVMMSCSTSGAIIFYTKGGPNGCTVNPTHNGANPTGSTLVYDPANPPFIHFGTAGYFKAVGYKAGFTDSAFTACIYEDCL